MHPKDYQNNGIKAFRDTTNSLPSEHFSSVNLGGELNQDQADTGSSTYTKNGHEAGWQHWGAGIGRTFGLWGQAVPVVYDGTDEKLYPISGTGLGADKAFQGKAITTNAVSNDPDTVRTVSALNDGQTGLVVQCLTNSSYELIFVGSETTAAIAARVRWDVSAIEDNSLCEIVSYDETTGSYIGTGAIGYIDFAASRSIHFETVGDGAIFKIELIRSNVYRPALGFLSLYRVSGVLGDFGKQITDVEIEDRENYIDDRGEVSDFLNFRIGKGVRGRVISRDDTSGEAPWNLVNAFSLTGVETTIGTSSAENFLLVRLGASWDLSGLENYRFLERSYTHGSPQPFQFRPPREIETLDPLNKIFSLYNEFDEERGRYKVE